MADKIQKIYDLSLIGADEVLAKMNLVNKSFDQAKKNFVEAKNKFKETETANRSEFEKSRNELLKQQTAQRNLRAETIAYNNVLNQQKLASKQAADATKVVAGSYEDLRLRAKALRTELKGNLVIEGVDPKRIAQSTADLKKLTSQMQHFDRSLTKNGTLVGEYTTGINRAFSSVGRNLLTMVSGFIGFQAIIGSVTTMKSLADSASNLQSELELSAEGVKELTDELARLDTRTKLTELENIAFIAAKAGVDPERLVGVTAALDKIKVAFGKDFGDVEVGTETLVKLINIFEGKENVTEQQLLKTGNAIRVLANESVASVPFLNDFSQRMAGLEGIFDNLELSQVLGLASGFEQFGQSAEVTSTALVRILPEMAKNSEKFAEIIGITKERFVELINTNPAEALLQLSEALVQGKGNVVDVVTALGETELGASRVTATLGVLGKNTDVFRGSIQLAGSSIQETGNITEAFNLKNANLAGTYDHVSKKISDAANNEGFKNLISATANIVLFFIKVLTAIPFGLVIAGITALTASWLYLKGQTVAATLAQQFNNRETLLGSVRHSAYRLGLISTTAATTATAAATRGLNVAMSASPLGIVLAALSLIIPVMSAYGDSTEETTEAIDEQNLSQAEQNRLLKERAIIQDELNKKEGKTIINGKIAGGKFKGEVGFDPAGFNKASGVDKTIEKKQIEDKAVQDALFPINIPLIKERVKQYNEQIDAFKGSQKELDKLIAARDKAQKELNDILGKEDKGATKAAKDAKKDADKELQDKINAAAKAGEDRKKEAEEIQKWQDDFQIKIIKDNQVHRSTELKELQVFFLKQRKLILDNTALTDKERKLQLEALDRAEQRTLLSAEILLLEDEVKEKKKLFDRSLITEEEYLDALAKLYAKQNELSDVLQNPKTVKQDRRFLNPSTSNTQNNIVDRITKRTKGKETDEETALLGDVVAESYNLANQAMNSYFDNEALRIQQSEKNKMRSLDVEQDIALSRAQTQAEEDIINKQFEQKRLQIQRSSFEEMKKVRRAEAAIAFATELANIAVAAAGNPANSFTAGTAGIIQYGILAGIAAARYGITVSNINKQTFEKGGSLPLRGGQFVGPSHKYGGITVGNNEFEGNELAIINKRSAQSNRTYSVTGTPKQIASSINTLGGGVSFASGATTIKHESGGYFGSRLQPPIMQSYYQNSTSNGSQTDLTDIKDMIKDLVRVVYAENVKPIILSERALTAKQIENQKRVEIGVL